MPERLALIKEKFSPNAPVSSSTPAATAAAPAAPVVQSYKIGDTGPAGGLIFYDKGNNSGGWRYLEAAPSDLPRKLEGVTESIDFSGCKERAVGRGKSNTQAIMAEAAKKGGGFGWAAQACDAFTFNGFDDWFLPSRDELHYMYGHLHMQGLGNFRNERYLSSSHGIHSWFIFEDFSNGKQDDFGTGSAQWVRPIRQF